MLVGEAADGDLRVLRVFRDSPAEKAGIEAGDALLAIDGARVGGDTPMSLSEASALLKGEGETPVEVEVERGGEVLSFTLERGEVSINYVEYSILEGNVGLSLHLSVHRRRRGGGGGGVKEAISAFQQAGVSALVVDVRSNPGGLLTDVVDICDMLLPEGLIVYTEDRGGAREEFYADGEYWDVPMAVLVNGDSASASEIFAAAVQDTGRGIVVGEVTYGKGVVQTLHAFPEGDGMQLTTATYYTPSGASIHGQGVTPDIEVALAGRRQRHLPRPGRGQRRPARHRAGSAGIRRVKAGPTRPRRQNRACPPLGSRPFARTSAALRAPVHGASYSASASSGASTVMMTCA